MVTEVPVPAQSGRLAEGVMNSQDLGVRGLGHLSSPLVALSGSCTQPFLSAGGGGLLRARPRA